MDEEEEKKAKRKKMSMRDRDKVVCVREKPEEGGEEKGEQKKKDRGEYNWMKKITMFSEECVYDG